MNKTHFSIISPDTENIISTLVEVLMAKASLAMTKGRDTDVDSRIAACRGSAVDDNNLFKAWPRENMCYWQRYP